MPDDLADDLADLLAAAVDRAFAAEAGYARTRKPDGRGHSMPPRDQVSRMIAAAAPILAEHIAQEILAHAEHRHPRDKDHVPTAWDRHFSIAARVAAGAFYSDEDKMRLAAEAIGRGEFTGCDIPEVPR